MRIERTVTSIAWIPSESTTGLLDLGMRSHLGHFDRPPPDAIGRPADRELDRLCAADTYRFSNQLRAWIDVEDGRVIDAGYTGGGRLGATTINLGLSDVTIAGIGLPDIRHDPEVKDRWVRFTQTTGGRTGVPLPRPVKRHPFVQFYAPIVWSTLELVINADASHSGRLTGASPFPRQWIYDDAGTLAAKTGLTDAKEWMASAFGTGTPWGDYDSPVVVTEAETALERELSTTIMLHGGKPNVVRFEEGDTVIVQGSAGDEIYLLLDGVVAIDVDGATVAELGPGAVLGERAAIEGRVRTSTVRCLTRCRAARAHADAIDVDRLAALVAGHHREDS